ncbi:MAG: hypothetical protein HWN79_14595 [Candidatus Lokiarchaeota archaeon]|nr:hypothetical protein [Candidatus Lokiarchaeota archaeon]
MSSGKADINYNMEILEGSEVYDLPRESVFEKLDINSFTNINFDKKLTKFYGKIINIHFFLSNNKELTNDQKLDYCIIERYFMKLYLRGMMKKK